MRRQLALSASLLRLRTRQWSSAARERVLLTALALIALAMPALVAATPDARSTDRPATSGAVCTANVQHPLEVRVVPLGAVRRGAPLAFEVRVTSRVPIAQAEARLVSAGGAMVRGPGRVVLDRVAPGRPAAARFEVQVPQVGRRFLLQFVVRGEGPAGMVTRGATYNVLPDGPADPGRVVTTSSGARVIEFAARRAGR